MGKFRLLPFLIAVVAAVLLAGGLFLAPRASAQPRGDPAAGKAFWEKFPVLWCLSCHGVNGEGAYGPDLAGRGLSFEQFKRAVRQPWGVMPAYTEQQVSDQDIADLVAYFNSLSKVAAPGPWRTVVPAGAPLGKRLIVETAGCNQCHGGDLDAARRGLGGKGADYHLFAELIYEHTKEYPTGRMGNFSRARLPEVVLEKIWDYLSKDVGLRAPVTAAMKASTTAATTTYELTITNTGTVGKGLTAGNMYISMLVPPGSTVVSATERGYQGVQGYAAGGYDVAVWLVPGLIAGQGQTYTLTVSGSGAPGGSHAFVRWLSPSFSPTQPGDFVMTAHTRP